MKSCVHDNSGLEWQIMLLMTKYVAFFHIAVVKQTLVLN